MTWDTDTSQSRTRIHLKKVYKNATTGKKEIVRMNQIEGAQKHDKGHFRHMSGTKVRQFEGHLAEIMWLSENKGNLCGGFFESLKTIFTLQYALDDQYTTPLFDSWTMHSESTVAPINTDAEEIQPVKQRVKIPIFHPIASGKRPSLPTEVYQLMKSSMTLVQTSHLYRELPQLECSSTNTSKNAIIISSSSADKTLTESGPSKPRPSKSKSKVTLRRKKAACPTVSSKKEKICAPQGFRPVDNTPSKKEKRKFNPYGKSAFV